MKAHVNDNCIGCGLCVDVCPEVFQIGDSGLAEAIDEVPAGKEESAKEARDGCPVQAIDIED